MLDELVGSRESVSMLLELISEGNCFSVCLPFESFELTEHSDICSERPDSSHVVSDLRP